MKLVHELIPSPRAGKRFINIYRLIRASVGDRDRSIFVGDAQGGEHRSAMLLLAILTGYPSEATEIFRELIYQPPTETWWAFVDGLNQRNFADGQSSPVKRWIELFAKLGRVRGSMLDQPCAPFVKWAPRIARYSFQSGRVLSAGQ